MIYVFAKPGKTAAEPSRESGLLPVPGFADAHKSLTADNTGSDVCIEFALSQLERCQHTHTKCRSMTSSRQQMTGFLPTRVIDVGYTDASKICLFEPKSYNVATSYIALSHCWGDSQPLRLTRATAAGLKAGIPLSGLPKTFQDAIHVSRKMQVRYLWIDSLYVAFEQPSFASPLTRSRCIVQDDPEDWQREAARMRDVYSGAICCIAATAAKDSTIGLFFDTDRQDLFPVQVKTSRALIHGQKTNDPLVGYTMSCMVVIPSIAIDAAPLNQRAWVAQERYLSTGTIHFTQELLFWECYESLTSEQDYKGLLISDTSKYYRDSTVHTLKSHICSYKTRQTDAYLPRLFSEIYKEWCAFRAAYSGCDLTKEGDILVALNGVALDVAEATNDTLVAGLWRGRLFQDMVWRRLDDFDGHSTDTTFRPSTWRAPTWSWASINRTIVSHELWWEDEEFSTLTNDMAIIENLFVDQKPSGELVDASLTLRCRLIPMSSPKLDDWTREPYNVTVILDDPMSSDLKDLGHEASLVILRHYRQAEKEKEVESEGIQGILLLPSRVKVGSYERVGYFEKTADEDDAENQIDEDARILQMVLDGYRNAKETTIEII